RTANEHAPATFGIANARYIEGSGNVHAGDGRCALHLRQFRDGLQWGVGFGERALDESHADPVLPRLDPYADVIEPVLHLVCRDRLMLIDRLQILRTAEAAIEHPVAVDSQDDVMRLVDLGDVTGAAEEELPDVELVLAVGRKVVLDEHAATGAER